MSHSRDVASWPRTGRVGGRGMAFTAERGKNSIPHMFVERMRGGQVARRIGEAVRR